MLCYEAKLQVSTQVVLATDVRRKLYETPNIYDLPIQLRSATESKEGCGAEWG